MVKSKPHTLNETLLATPLQEIEKDNTMSKVIVFNLPKHGRINPSLAVIKELVARGEQVIYYTIKEFDTKIKATGAIRHYAFNDS